LKEFLKSLDIWQSCAEIVDCLKHCGTVLLKDGRTGLRYDVWQVATVVTASRYD